MKVSYRNTKNINIFSWPEHAEIKILTPLYWIPSTVLMLSPHCTDVIPPHVLMLSPHCTEPPPQYWSYPPHSTEAIPPLYWTTSTVLKLCPHSTEAIPPQYWCYPPDVLNNLQCTEQPPQYWTDVMWGVYNNTQDPNTKSTINKLQKEIMTKMNQESTISWEKFCNSISLKSDPKNS